MHFVRGNITQPQLGMADEDIDRLQGKIDHFFHLAAIYDMRASEEANVEANVGGTRHMLALAKDLQARRLHLTSSVAIAGNYEGFFREDMFDEGQVLPTSYHRTKWESERLVRTESEVPWRVYRPGIVVGDSRTGQMDKIDGPYYFFKAIQRIGHYLPEWIPLAGPELGWTNIVPVDFVTSAMDHIAHQPDLDNRAFHLTDPKGIRVGESLNIFAKAAHAPQMGLRIDKRILDMIPKGVFSMLLQIPALKYVRRDILADLGIPESVLDNLDLKPRFDTRDAEAALAGSGISVPPLDSYAGLLYDYWQRHLDPDLFKDRSLAGAVRGKTVLITGGSSGIGKTSALRIAEAGGIPLLVARTESKLQEVKKEIEGAGGVAKIYPTDLTSLEEIDDLVKRVLAENAKIDFLVNNAGRSIRRGIMHSLDRFDGYERTMQLNYFGTIRLDHRPDPALAEHRRRARRQRLLDRRADQPAALFGLRRVEGGAGRLHRLRVERARAPQDHIHDDPHAARADADDRSYQDLRRLPGADPRRGCGPGDDCHPDEAQGDQHQDGYLRGGHGRAGTQAQRPDPQHGVQGLPRLDRGGHGPGPRPADAAVERGQGPGAPDEGRLLVGRTRSRPAACHRA